MQVRVLQYVNVQNFCVTYFLNQSLLVHEGGPYHMEVSPLICSANQWTGFYMIGTSVFKELILESIEINQDIGTKSVNK